MCHRHRCSSFGYGWQKSCGFVCKPVVPLQDAYVTLHFTPTPNVTPHKGIRDCSVGAPDDRHDVRHDVRHSSFVTIRRPVPLQSFYRATVSGGCQNADNDRRSEPTADSLPQVQHTNHVSSANNAYRSLCSTAQALSTGSDQSHRSGSLDMLRPLISLPT